MKRIRFCKVPGIDGPVMDLGKVTMFDWVLQEKALLLEAIALLLCLVFWGRTRVMGVYDVHYYATKGD